VRAYLLRPVDTFFFRDHKPFSMGEEAKATGWFPPRPGTVYGALRSAYIHRYGDFSSFYEGRDPEIRRWMGTPEAVGDFSIRAVWLHDAQGAVLPLPLDYQVVKEEDKEKGHPLILTQEKEKGHWASDGTQWRLYASEDRKSASAADAYLGESEWREKAAFHRNISSIARAERWLQKEPKIGIARDAQTMRAKEGMLYQLPMHRFREEQGKSDTGLLVLCDRSPSFDDIRYVLLGGEGRPWHLTPLQRERLLYSEEEEEQLIQQIREREMARIILLTPAIWKRGTRPACYDETTQELHLPGDLRVKLLTAAVGRPLVIGGWDMKKNRPKPRKLAVPAGSVLVVKVKGQQADQLVRTIHSMKLTDELGHEGYGCAVCGVLTTQKERG
jgi:CRISPR-associated protein Cmr3